MDKALMFSLIFAFCSSCSHSGEGSTGYYEDKTSSSRPSVNQGADWQITTKVKSAILTDITTSGRAHMINVETTNGIVTLTGTVESIEEARKIEQKVRAISGVRAVNNQLLIAP